MMIFISDCLKSECPLIFSQTVCVVTPKACASVRRVSPCSDNLHEKIESTYGAMLSATLKIGFHLNERGRARLLDYAYDLAKIEEYKK